MAKKSDDYSSIRARIEANDFAPVYLLHGEESFYIDQLTDLLMKKVIPDDEARDFDLMEFYGGTDCQMADVISACRRYPMMGDRTMVTLREMQAFDKRQINFDDLCLYLNNPQEGTVLLLTCKTTKLTGAQKLLKICKEKGVVFESVKLRDYELKRELPSFLASMGLKVDAAACELLADFVGSDLSRIMLELDKVKTALNGKTHITKEDICAHVGISKEFNVWELNTAIAERNFHRVELIRRYFAQNPKAGPPQMVIPAVFGFFSSLMLAHYSPDKSQKGLMSSVGCSFPAAKDLTSGLRNYNAWKTMNNISILREFDARSKGGRGGNTPPDELLQELFFQLMH